MELLTSSAVEEEPPPEEEVPPLPVDDWWRRGHRSKRLCRQAESPERTAEDGVAAVRPVAAVAVREQRLRIGMVVCARSLFLVLDCVETVEIIFVFECGCVSVYLFLFGGNIKRDEGPFTLFAF